MTNEQQINSLNQAISIITDVRNSLMPPPSDIVDITPGQSIQSALDKAKDGITFRLAPATYDGPITVQKDVTFVSLNPPPPNRATPDASVWITSNSVATVTVTPESNGAKFIGIGAKNQNADGGTIWLCKGISTIWDRCVTMGDPANGQRRGWQTEGKNNLISGCYADNIGRPGRDTVVIGGWQDCDGLGVDNSYLRGGAETIMFGGADSPSADRICKNISITNCYLTKNPDWYAQKFQYKNAFELKSAINVYMGNCLLEYGGVAEGYILVLTVRNQNGHAPWETVQHVKIEKCNFRRGGGGINFLGNDSNHESVNMTDILLTNCKFSDLNPEGLWSQFTGYKGAGRVFNFGRKPDKVTMDGITVSGLNNIQ
jgi:hypothetical protein